MSTLTVEGSPATEGRVMAMKTLFAIVGAVILIVGMSGIAAAQGGDGPPDALPDPVPDFVSDVLGSIMEVIDGGIDNLGEIVRSITPGGGDAPPDGAGR